MTIFQEDGEFMCCFFLKQKYLAVCAGNVSVLNLFFNSIIKKYYFPNLTYFLALKVTDCTI